MVKVNDMSIQTWRVGDGWRMKVVYDDGREWVNDRLFPYEPEAIGPGMIFCLGQIIEVSVEIEGADDE